MLPTSTHDSHASSTRSPGWRFFWAGLALFVFGQLVAPVVTIVGMESSFRRIEALPAPTPDELAVGVDAGLIATAIGLLLGLVGLALLLVGVVRIARNGRTS
ncbi:MAG: MotA/TolQ/ExbB proton channel family protein [Planctomycetes bacterium]|nr:MotA/TolQ/ExbB proton channel family protein [Planctomycetota bacterium]